MGRADFEEFTRRPTRRPTRRLAGHARAWPVKAIDGKPPEVSHNSTDRDARWGRGVSRTANGYEPHAVRSAGHDLPDAFAVAPPDARARSGWPPAWSSGRAAAAAAGTP